uniref:Uncharacterized protein n=1 Tax=Cacopsylla melanoneura TaxID=428564 RepID=A0A8D9EI06_9HEMI
MESPCITVYNQGCEFPFFFFFPLGKKIGKFVEKNAILRRGRNNSSGGRGANMTGIYENENQNSSPYLLLLLFFLFIITLVRTVHTTHPAENKPCSRAGWVWNFGQY